MNEFLSDYLNVVTKNYSNFTGRARRREYWMFVLVNVIITVVLSIIDRVFFGRMNDGAGMPLLQGLYGLALLVPSLAVAARRLHDTGRSGWMQLLGIIPLIGSLILIYFYVQDSQPGANKWGPNPKTGERSAVSANSNW